VAPGSAAEEIGLQVGDRFVAIEGTSVNSLSDLKMGLMLGAEGRKLGLKVERNGTHREFTVASEALFRDSAWTFPQLGVQVDAFEVRDVGGPVDWAALSLADCGRVVDGSRRFFLGLFKHPTNARHASGPIGMVRAIKQTSEVRLTALLWVAAMISMALAVFNLVPAAILDGTRMLFASLHIALGKAIPRRVQSVYTAVTAMMLVWLMIFSTYGDVVRLFIA
ncbi:MAG: RIP metalloprotease, partial [Bdellovibrionales bacterium]|nr:RIP metalloprotease [Bdellovibrionales bacterium]